MNGAQSRRKLAEEFGKRSKLNPRFSLRSYARFLGLSPSFLSAVLKGKKNISVEKAFDIAKRLGYSEQETVSFCRSVQEKGPLELTRMSAEVNRPKRDFDELALDRFALISEWHHFAVLELSLCIDGQLTPQLVARRLGIPRGAAGEAIRRLVKLGLLSADKGGFLRKSKIRISTPTDVPSQALRSHHAQLIAKASEALSLRPVAERDISSMTLSIRRSDLRAAKEEIQRFQRRMVSLFADATPDSVYQLNVQLFELTSK